MLRQTAESPVPLAERGSQTDPESTITEDEGVSHGITVKTLTRPASGTDTREIPLTKGYVAIVDAADYELVSVSEWNLDSTSSARTFYTRGRGTVKYMSMHRWIAGLEPGDGWVMHHVNGNGLDNRRCNLLVMTRAAHHKGHNFGLLFPPKIYRRGPQRWYS